MTRPTGTAPTRVLPAWPVFVALGLVGVLIAGMVGLDVILGQSVSSQTDSIVENSEKSIVLLDTMRTYAQNLSEVGVDAGDAQRLTAQLDATARDYDPLATYKDEHVQWEQLQDLLHELTVAALDDHARRSRLADEIDRSVDQLIEVNAEEGRANAKEIRGVHRQAIWNDLVVGGITFTLVAVISIVLIRALARQRQIVKRHLAALEDKTRDLEAFAGRAAHDLRSPMNPIRGYSDLLLEARNSPEDVVMMARRIRTSVDRMARVVDDMLALSTAGHPTAGMCATGDVIKSVMEELAPDLHGYDVTTRLAAGRAACGGGTLNQLLRNLIGNAVKFRSRTRSLKIIVETRDVESMVEIAVEDNGMGMDAEAADHAFEPLFRGRTDREVPGNGLGLAIVERTTRALGGGCELSSVLDQGTKITVRLPRA